MPIPNRPRCGGYYDGEEDYHPCNNLADFSYWRQYKDADESSHYCQPCHNVVRGI